MKKKIKYSIFIFLVFIFTNGCQKLKDGLEGNKRSKSSEEFLIETKPPLVMPPKFDELPVPESEKISKENRNKFNINKVLNGSSTDKDSKKNKINKTLEQSIIENIQSR